MFSRVYVPEQAPSLLDKLYHTTTHLVQRAVKTVTTPWRARKERHEAQARAHQAHLRRMLETPTRTPTHTPAIPAHTKQPASTPDYVLVRHGTGSHTYHTLQPRTDALEDITNKYTVDDAGAFRRIPSRQRPGDIYSAHMEQVHGEQLTPYNKARSMGRAERLERLINTVFSHDNQAHMTARQAAEYFGVSKSTIYRDVQYLRELTHTTLHFKQQAGFMIDDRHVRDENVTQETTLPTYKPVSSLAAPQQAAALIPHTAAAALASRKPIPLPPTTNPGQAYRDPERASQAA